MKLLSTFKDKYELTKSISVTDVKGYLQKEYDRANKRENLIREYEKQIKDLKRTELKYEALLVIQENTQQRIEKQDDRINELKEEIAENEKTIKLLNSKNLDIKENAEQKLKEKDKEIKELKKQIKKSIQKGSDKE